MMEFFRPETIDEAVDLLARHEGARCIAGGATLVAMMNAGLAEPTALISMKRVRDIRGIVRREDGLLRIGAMTRHAETARSLLFRDGQRVVPEAASRIANPPVRNMGTMGGSLCFADPAADYLPALVVADAIVEALSPRGHRMIPIGEFIADWYTTVLAPDEIVTTITLPPAPAGSIGVYEKLDRVAGDFAIVSVALVVAFAESACRAARIAIGGCGPAPIRRREAEQVLEGSRLEPKALAEAGRLLVAASDPVDDVRATAEYRRMVLPRMLAKAAARAEARAGIAG